MFIVSYSASKTMNSFLFMKDLFSKCNVYLRRAKTQQWITFCEENPSYFYSWNRLGSRFLVNETSQISERYSDQMQAAKKQKSWPMLV